MDDLKNQIINEFRKLAEVGGAQWSLSEKYCELSKNGVVLRIRWSIERIQGVFVTLVIGNRDHPREYGLPYLVEFRGGGPKDVAGASSDDPKTTAEVVKKYAVDLLDGAAMDLPAFADFVDEQVRARTPPAPTIKATKWVRPEWI